MVGCFAWRVKHLQANIADLRAFAMFQPPRYSNGGNAGFSPLKATRPGRRHDFSLRSSQNRVSCPTPSCATPRDRG